MGSGSCGLSSTVSSVSHCHVPCVALPCVCAGWRVAAGAEAEVGGCLQGLGLLTEQD